MLFTRKPVKTFCNWGAAGLFIGSTIGYLGYDDSAHKIKMQLFWFGTVGGIMLLLLSHWYDRFILFLAPEEMNITLFE